MAATGTKIGSLLINPGGPGTPGVDTLHSLASSLSASLRAQFDIVSFDSRGVNLSSPVRCASGPELDKFIHLNPAPTTDAGFKELVDAARTFVQGCQARSGALLPYVGTINAARDMDQIRAAVGDGQLTYLGFSYGTYLGAIYADLFPTHVRAMVLDGAIDPTTDPIQVNIDQSTGFDNQLNAFFSFCASTPSCSWRPGGDLKTAFEALVTKITATPLPGIGARTLGPGEAFYGVASRLYQPSSWPDLALGLSKAEAGNGSVLLGYADQYFPRNDDGTYRNDLEAATVISCDDQPWPRDPARLRQAAEMAKQRAPEFGVTNLYSVLACTLWPIPTHPTNVTPVPTATPILVVGSTRDPATPYADAQTLTRELQNAILLTRVGDGHTGYPFSACIRTDVDQYLVSLAVPAANTNCPSP
jgi:pimeloyl-ACP methyl ester carboxylesterase